MKINLNFSSIILGGVKVQRSLYSRGNLALLLLFDPSEVYNECAVFSMSGGRSNDSLPCVSSENCCLTALW